MNGRKGRNTAFAQRLGVLQSTDAKKPSLLARLAKAGL